MEMDFPSRKRLKLDSDSSSSSDPFIVLHNDLHGLIYQHFCGKDVCELFKVSKQWNSRTSESPKGMEKVQLNFHEYSATYPTPQSVTALLKSQRRYQNIKFSLRFAANGYRKLLILQRFSQSVSRLDISIHTQVDATRFIPANLSFPKLKELHLTGGIPCTLFKDLKTLEKLRVCYKSWRHDEFRYVIHNLDQLDIFDFFKDNNNLNDLELNYPDLIFNNGSFYDSKYKLKSFSMNHESSQLPREYFHDFLLFHSETLTSLTLDFVSANEADIILTKLPVLKELQAHRIIEVIKVQSNKSISSLKCDTLSDARNILESLKSIENVEVNHYSEDDFRWVIKNVMQLKKLKFVYPSYLNKPDCTTIIAAYNTFKIDDAPVNENIEIVVENMEILVNNKTIPDCAQM